MGIRDLHIELAAILAEAIKVGGACRGNIQKFNPLIPGLQIVAHSGFDKSFLHVFRCVGIDDSSSCAIAFRANRTVFIADVLADSRFVRYRKIAARSGFRGVQSTPIPGINGQPIGMLSTHFARETVLPRAAVKKLRALAARAAVVLEEFNTQHG